jgi:aminoglycoside phosphotransferase (APT) family kinase protein
LSVIFSEAARDWLGRSVAAAGSSLAIMPMGGSTSSSLFSVERTGGPAAERYVLRVLDNREWLAEEPDLANHEAAALTEAREAGLLAPRLVAYAADDVGFGAPAVLMTFIAGAVELRPADFPCWLRVLAAQLAAIHRCSADGFPWRFRSWVNRVALVTPAWSAVPRLWERAIEFWLRGAPDERFVFIHRDYHPANVLWREGAVSGVVDWINACRGPAGVDVAHCRTNLAGMYGPAAADEFLTAYRDAADGFTYDPYWDLDSLLDMCLAGPSYYPPWQEFGLGAIPAQVLRQRIDAYLESVIRRIA